MSQIRLFCRVVWCVVNVEEDTTASQRAVGIPSVLHEGRAQGRVDLSVTLTASSATYKSVWLRCTFASILFSIRPSRIHHQFGPARKGARHWTSRRGLVPVPALGYYYCCCCSSLLLTSCDWKTDWRRLVRLFLLEMLPSWATNSQPLVPNNHQGCPPIQCSHLDCHQPPHKKALGKHLPSWEIQLETVQAFPISSAMDLRASFLATGIVYCGHFVFHSNSCFL